MRFVTKYYRNDENGRDDGGDNEVLIMKYIF